MAEATRTDTEYIWEMHGKFYFQDEAEQIDNGPFETKEKAIDALTAYVEWLNDVE